jgi:hypothetical protein
LGGPERGGKPIEPDVTKAIACWPRMEQYLERLESRM